MSRFTVTVRRRPVGIAGRMTGEEFLSRLPDDSSPRASDGYVSDGAGICTVLVSEVSYDVTVGRPYAVWEKRYGLDDEQITLYPIVLTSVTA